MSKKLLITLCLVSLLFIGCRRGDIEVSPVIEGQLAPHRGWNIGPGLWLEKGDPVKITGADIWIGFDPNDLFGE